MISHFKLLPPIVLPNPIDVIQSARFQLLTGALTTTSRAIAGFLIGILLSYLFHFLCVAFKVEQAMDAQFAGMRAVPVIAVMPLFVIWFGFSETGRLLIVILSAVVFFIAPLHESYKLLGRDWTILRDQLSLNTFSYYLHIVAPGTFGSLLGPLRVALAVAFTISIASEYIGAQTGIGKVLDAARVTFNVPAIILTILIASIIGVCLDKITTALYTKFIKWAGKQGKT